MLHPIAECCLVTMKFNVCVQLQDATQSQDTSAIANALAVSTGGMTSTERRVECEIADAFALHVRIIYDSTSHVLCAYLKTGKVESTANANSAAFSTATNAISTAVSDAVAKASLALCNVIYAPLMP